MLPELRLNPIYIRPLRLGDSIDDLTSMLHRAFGDLGRRGLRCTCVEQSLDTTLQRIQRGSCYLALDQHHIVGTMTLEVPDPGADVAWYRQPQVASLHQLAVDPRLQGSGCGKALLRVAQRWALKAGYGQLALDTPSRAAELVGFYQGQGFQVVDRVQLPGRAYESTVLSMTLAPRH